MHGEDIEAIPLQGQLVTDPVLGNFGGGHFMSKVYEASSLPCWAPRVSGTGVVRRPAADFAWA